MNQQKPWSGVSAIMCFASPKQRECHSRNSVEMTPFRENVLGTVFGKAAYSKCSLFVAVAHRSLGGFFFEKFKPAAMFIQRPATLG